MLDAELAAALVEACEDGTRLLLVGDPAQLPSIGPGRVLADIIDSGAAPVTELTTLYRQRAGGVIARLATSVRGGELPPVDAGGPGSGQHEAVIVPVRGSQQAALRVRQLVTDSIPRAHGIPAADIQVVTPVHKGPAGTIELNRALKAMLNPGPGAHGGFDPGDRVVATANHIDEGFANGEVGTVTAPADEGLVVTFASIQVTVPSKLLGDLRHGWAMTVHRAQGSRSAVVAVFPAEATGMLSRPLVYTALTRAQRHLSVVHQRRPRAGPGGPDHRRAAAADPAAQACWPASESPSPPPASPPAWCAMAHPARRYRGGNGASDHRGTAGCRGASSWPYRRSMAHCRRYRVGNGTSILVHTGAPRGRAGDRRQPVRRKRPAVSRRSRARRRRRARSRRWSPGTSPRAAPRRRARRAPGR